MFDEVVCGDFREGFLYCEKPKYWVGCEAFMCGLVGVVSMCKISVCSYLGVDIGCI